jgi:hypothetical protein
LLNLPTIKTLARWSVRLFLAALLLVFVTLACLRLSPPRGETRARRRRDRDGRLVWRHGRWALAAPPSAVIVFGPPASLAAAIEAADASILSVGEGFVTAKGDRAGFTKRLYAGGAWFVWPALPAFCGRNKRDKG